MKRALQYFRSNQTPPCRTSAPQTSAHAPLFVRICSSEKAWVYPIPPLPAYVRPSFVAAKYQTDARAVSWYKLVTYVGVGRCVIYIALGPLALGCVNNAASYTSVCNLYMQATLTVFTQSDAAATKYFLLQKWAASIRGRLLNGGGTYFCYINTMMTLLASLEVQVTSEHLRVGPN